MRLQNKIILLISPQAWGKMFLAKHHYAIELTKYGNRVYFLNPPEQGITGIEIKQHESIPGLFLIRHSLFFPFQIKFKFKKLFHLLMKFHVKKIMKAVGKQPDIIWSFDLGDYYPLKYFGNHAFKIFFPIDEPLNKDGIDSARCCNVIFSVTEEILEKYSAFDVPKHFTHHGLAAEFIEPGVSSFSKNDKIHFGLSGNWLRTDIDVACLIQIVSENPGVIFEFWGACKAEDSNIGGGSDSQAESMIGFLQKAHNVVLHGVVHPEALAKEFQRMDGFLICYDILKDQSKGTNYHKVMEYLSTGKVVVSNNITTYDKIPGLLEMSKSRADNTELPDIFKEVISKINLYNNSERLAKRKQFAFANSYARKIIEMELLMDNHHATNTN